MYCFLGLACGLRHTGCDSRELSISANGRDERNAHFTTVPSVVALEVLAGAGDKVQASSNVKGDGCCLCVLCPRRASVPTPSDSALALVPASGLCPRRMTAPWPRCPHPASLTSPKARPQTQAHGAGSPTGAGRDPALSTAPPTSLSPRGTQWPVARRGSSGL